MYIRGYCAVAAFAVIIFVPVVFNYAQADAIGFPEAPELVKKAREARAILSVAPLAKEIEACVKIRGSVKLRCVSVSSAEDAKQKRISSAGKLYRLKSADFLLRVEDADGAKTIRLRQIFPPLGSSGFLFEVVASDFVCDPSVEHIDGIGISRRYAVVCGDEEETKPVLAASYLMAGKNAFSSLAELESKIRRITYSPFADEYATADMVSYGGLFARALIDSAFQNLQEKKIVSRAYPDRLVSEAYDKNFSYIILISEQCDPREFNAWGSEFCAKKVLTTLALNEWGVYPTMNKSGAAGAMQFTNTRSKKSPGTYDMVWGAYPEAGLIPEFPRGAYDFVNAVTAEILLIDYELSRLLPWVRDAYVKDARSVVLCLAAAYHSGAGVAADLCSRPAKTVSLDGFQYPTRFKKVRRPRIELEYYLRKFVALEKLYPIAVSHAALP